MKRQELRQELRGLSAGELKAREQLRREEHLKLRFRRASTGQLDQSHRLREVRREIALLKTIVREKEEVQA